MGSKQVLPYQCVVLSLHNTKWRDVLEVQVLEEAKQMETVIDRHTYLARIGRLVRPPRCIFLPKSYDWEERFSKAIDYLPRFLHGLPVEVQVSLALRAVNRYRPNYEFCNPGDQRVSRVVEAVETWLNDRSEGNARLQECRVGNCSEPKGYWQFLEAVSLLRYSTLRWCGEVDRLTVATASILEGCIRQRMDDIWRADNPRDYEAEKRIQEIDEILGVNGDRLSDEEKRRLEQEMDTLIEMQESSQRNNIVVRAVACRELSILTEWMREIADLYPEGARPSRRTIRMWWGGWDDAERVLRG
ncbi:MAG: hypothetical protein KatS3mg022_0821 [Armatimonadota bacterium]|nr:MAG: hypothetical protein KatS3mg022_0821 [Armatimonadota bacterium]